MEFVLICLFFFLPPFSELPGLVLSAVIVDRIGRKLSLEIMFMFACIFLLPLVFHQHEILTMGLLFGARMFVIGTFTVAGIYAPEVNAESLHILKRSSFSLIPYKYQIFTYYLFFSYFLSLLASLHIQI